VKWLICCVAALICLPSTALGIWYAVSFLPHLADLQQVVQRGHESIERVEPSLYALALAGEKDEKSIRIYAIRQAYFSLAEERLHRGPIPSWIFNYWLWYCAIWIHFSAGDVFAIWADCAVSGCGHGLSDVARRYFEKDVSELSETQLAALVAVVQRPNQFAPGTEAGNRRAQEILERAMVSKAR
jgi:Transglycosylase